MFSKWVWVSAGKGSIISSLFTFQIAKPVPRLQALTVDREVSFDYDDIGFGESDDEVGDDEQPKGTGKKCPIKHPYINMSLIVKNKLACKQQRCRPAYTSAVLCLGQDFWGTQVSLYLNYRGTFTNYGGHTKFFKFLAVKLNSYPEISVHFINLSSMSIVLARE